MIRESRVTSHESRICNKERPSGRVIGGSYYCISRLATRDYLLLISALSRRIIASRLSDGSAPVITSSRSPRCIAMV